jgi:ABC-2 type transport system permease protein
MILQTLTIARTTFIEAVRQPVLLIMVLISGVLQIFNTWSTGFAMGMEETSEVVGDNKLLLDIGLATIFVLGAVLAGFLATAVISREIENKTVLTIVSKPVPRAVLIIGKYLGVVIAILGAMTVMLLYLLFSIRHGVMSTASDEVDYVVVLFSVGTAALSLLLGGWCNFFYNWNFAQISSVFLFPTTLLGYICTLFISKKWTLQPLFIDFKPQITVACLCLMMAVMVLTAVAVAASTRLGRVMTIVVCFGVFVFSLFSNYLIGRHVFVNESIAVIKSALPDDPTKNAFISPDHSYTIEFELAPKRPLPPGTAFYFSPSPSGYPMGGTKDYSSYNGDLSNIPALANAAVPSSIIVTESKPPYQRIVVRNIGQEPILLLRPPERGDVVFANYTQTNIAALGAWGALPNLQFYWLLDAISQNRKVTIEYFTVALVYALCQVGLFLSLAVVLFQRRDVG